MKKLLIFLLLISVVQAVSYEGFKYSGDEFRFDNVDFSLKLSSSEEVLLFKSGLETLSVSVGNCESTQYYKYCFNEAVIDYDRGLVKLHDYTGEEMPALDITILSLKPELKVTRTATNLKPNEYEDVTITVTITNEGKKGANIIYKELVNAFKCDNCGIQDNYVIYSVPISAKSEKVFSYKVNANDTITLAPSLYYETDVSNGTIPIVSLTIQPVKTLGISYVGESSLLLEKAGKGVFTFKNNDLEKTLDFETTLLSDNFEFSKTTFSGNLKPLESKDFDVDFLAIHSGNENIFFNNDYKLGVNSITTNKTFVFKVLVDKPVFDFNVDTEVFSDKQNEANLTIITYANNFKNIFINITIENITAENFIIPFLRYKREVQTYNNKFASVYDKETIVEAKIKSTHYTLYGEELSYEVTKKIKVKPLLDLLEVEHDLEDYNQKKGRLVISTYVKNNNDNTEIIDFHENVDGATVLTNDGRKIDNINMFLQNSDIYITGLSKKQAVSYMIENNSKAIIITNIDFEGVNNNYLLTQVTEIDILKKESKIINKTITIVSEKFVSENSTEKEISGVLVENIQIEEAFKEEAETTKIAVVKEVAQEAKEVKPQIIPDAKVSEAPVKKGFFQKIIDIIMSFF